MFSLRNILVAVLAVVVATAGVPVFAKTTCPMASETQQTIKDCPNCVEKSSNQAQHNKCCGMVDCAISCSSSVSMNISTNMTAAFLPVIHAVDTVRPSDDAVISLSTKTQERPPKHLA